MPVPAETQAHGIFPAAPLTKALLPESARDLPLQGAWGTLLSANFPKKGGCDTVMST